MDKYVVNGVEIEFDTFDLFSIEAFQSEAERVRDVALELQENQTLDGLFHAVESMMDAFDVMCGEGTAAKLFGDRTNVKEVSDAYAEFTRAVKKRMDEAVLFGGEPKQAAALTDDAIRAAAPMNREQRRAIEREERRRAAREKVDKFRSHD